VIKMAVDLKRVRRGVQKLPPRILTYGFDGVGKTEFAAGAPGVFFLDANKGSHKFDVGAVDITSWDDGNQWVNAIANNEVKLQGGKPIETVVLDSITDFESMSHAAIFPEGETVTSFKGGYGKGDDYALLKWRPTLAQIERIWLSGKRIIFVAHARVKNFQDPTAPAYDRFEIAARPALAGALRQWCDFVLFCREETSVTNGKGVTSGVRWMYTRRTPAYDAKARASLLFPERILLSWQDFQKALDADGDRGPLEESISEMLSEIGDPAFDKAVRDYVKQYPSQIVEARNRVSAKLEEFRKSKEQSNG
jgi:hypothetical protein